MSTCVDRVAIMHLFLVVLRSYALALVHEIEEALNRGVLVSGQCHCIPVWN